LTPKMKSCQTESYTQYLPSMNLQNKKLNSSKRENYHLKALKEMCSLILLNL